ncbi:cation ATPase [Theileria orientalis]|uniref:Cation ATPase n=1 Tax=Theileria orientalis TaxID=68886 RepID=A0A976QTB1_THEOR|nr:cation ATPase [Theileria orientalis]
MVEGTSRAHSKESNENGSSNEGYDGIIAPRTSVADANYAMAPYEGDISIQKRISKILSRQSYPGFADIVEMEAVQRLSKSHIDPGAVIEFVKSRDLTKFYEAKQKVEEMHPTSGKSEYAHLPLEEVMNKFGLEDTIQGLSESQILFNREMYGENVLDLGKKAPIWKIFLSQFKSFVIVLLFIAAIASLALKNYIEGGFIIFIVLVNSTMATYMERSAANVLEKLAQLSSPVARVIRNATEMEVTSKEVVPGDILVLKTGDTVVADIRLFEVMEMRINESLLTGESVDVKKTTVSEDMDSPFSTNLCFASTSVVSGFGKGIVVNTGMNTQVGKIAKQLKKASETSKITPLQRGLNRLGGTIGIISTLVLVTIVVVAILTKFDDPTRPNTNRTLSIVLLAVGFAASSIPEGLPMVVTISLSLGAKDMAKENANVLKLPSVETLGCCSIICSDKTGTLTEGKMVTTDMTLFYSSGESNASDGGSSRSSGATPRETKTGKDNNASKKDGTSNAVSKTVSHSSLKFYPTYGFNPRGGVFYSDELTDEFRDKIITMYRKKDFDFGQMKENVMSQLATDGTSGVGEAAAARKSRYMDANRSDKVRYFESMLIRLNMTTCYLNSYNTKLVFDEETNKWTCVGNMTESPLVVAATKCGVTPSIFEDYERLERLEVPFSSKRKMSMTVHKLKKQNHYEYLNLERGTIKFTHVALVKGAPDVLRKYCKYLVMSDSTGREMRVNYDHGLVYDESDGGSSTDGAASPVSRGSTYNYTGSNVVMKMNNALSKASLRVIMIGIVPLTDEDVGQLSSFDDSEERQHYILTGKKGVRVGSSEASEGKVDAHTKLSDARERVGSISSNDPRRSSPKFGSMGENEGAGEVEGRVVLLGITGSFDPPRPGVRDAIETCRSAGVRVIMITGDQKTTAVAIGKQIGITEMGEFGYSTRTNWKSRSRLFGRVKSGLQYIRKQSIELTGRMSHHSSRRGSGHQSSQQGNKDNKHSGTQSKQPNEYDQDEHAGQKEKITHLNTLNKESSNESHRENNHQSLSSESQTDNNQRYSQYSQRSDLSEELGLECSHLHVNNNPSMDYLPDEEIDLITSKYNVFCRAQPEDKVAIVNSLKRKGEITAMTGDGVNDAAALKTADIGISMGINGTDVAKGASELVLLDDNFCTIVNAVRAGRTIYSNIQKFVSFLLGTNIGEILYLTTSIIIRTLPPVEALQILFLNFLTDGCPAVALSREPADDDAMKKPPRRPKTPIMTKEWWLLGNLPHTIFEALAVIAAILVGLYLCTGVLTLNDIHGQCKYVHLNDASGTSHELVYFCKSYEYVLSRKYTGWVTNVNYFDPHEKKMKVFLGATKGRVYQLRSDDPSLHPTLKAKFADMSAEKLAELDAEMGRWVELDENGWPKSKASQVVGKGKLYGAGETGYREIVGRKATQARTISFITAVWSEMLRAYTVRSWDYFYKVFNRNPWMHFACSLSATVTFALTVIPGVSTVLHVSSLPYWQYLLSIAFALTTLILDECISKVLYKSLKKKGKVE